MAGPLFRSAAWILIVAVLLMLSATTGGAFAHEIQHAAHHTAGMHSTGICAWMCAAAGVMITLAIQPPIVALIEAAPPLLLSLRRPFDSINQLQARAPPTLLT